MGNVVPFSIRHLSPRNTYELVSQSYFCGQPTWDPARDMPDMSGKTVVVTGGNAGIGKETVLLTWNATVYMASRNASKAEAAIQELFETTGKRAIFLELDLADLGSVKRAAEEFLRKGTLLHILYNNGGIMAPPIEAATSTGYDLTFATNVLGHFYLTKLLLPAMISTASKDGSSTRIITMTSMAHYVASVDYASFKDGALRRKRTPFDLYAQSKWADAVFAMELARRYGDQGIVSVAVNPGNLKTDISHGTKGTLTLLSRMTLIHPPAWGSISQLWAGTATEAGDLNGKYVAPWGRIGRPRPDVEDPKNGAFLWAWLEEQLERDVENSELLHT
ncbi:unnamed protein product [Mycena citricolor]|uniref:NAD(P)-binding protein n=1 Tax=Mycena citricolor TaxID=2018698 RepID=A0AAD2GSB4_9AGAR|nr:unnamed protein product [Mycena citricolor]